MSTARNGKGFSEPRVENGLNHIGGFGEELQTITKDIELDYMDSGEVTPDLGIDDGQLKKLTSDIKQEVHVRAESALRYGLRDNPPIAITLMGALQHVLLSLSGCLTTSSVVADVACVPYDHHIRSHLFCTTMFMVGACTILQTAFGVRLPIFQGPSSSFLVPLLALQRDPSWQCHSESDTTVSNEERNITATTNSSGLNSEEYPVAGIHRRLQEMSGALIIASLIEVIMGLSGMLKVMLQFIGPITIACTISLIGLSIIKLPIIYGRANFPLAITCMVLVMVFILYLRGVAIPLPRRGKASKNKPRPTFPIFQLLPILLAVIIVWIITWVLTVCGVFTEDKSNYSYMARADAKANVIASSSWFQLTYPGQFGPPKLNIALTLGFAVACFSSMIESVGDYYAAQEVCQIPSLPDHAISRGILIEGVGSIFSGFVGAGHATTSYSGNIAVLTLTKTASRMVMYAAGTILLSVSFLGKAGAALTTIPNPILGGVMMIIVSTLVSIGLANLKHVDMSLSRNLLVVGIPLISGLVVPACLDMYPNLIQTGQVDVDRVLTVILGTPMFLGGLLALILDSSVPGTMESRGMADWEHALQTDSGEQSCDDVYSWSIYPRLVKFCPLLGYLPFLPNGMSFRKMKKHKDHKKNINFA